MDFNLFKLTKFGSGDADAVVPLPGTRYSINALFLPTISNWYAWYDEAEVSATIAATVTG
jgi:hypothetical protein